MLLFFVFIPFTSTISAALAEQTACLYQSSDGKIHKVDSLSDVPHSRRKQAKCFNVDEGSYLARPEDITLKGNLRREDITTSLGRMKIRWPRKVETLFGRTPMRAITDVAETVSRALKTSAFPAFVQNIDIEWQVVFLDQDLPATEIPAHLLRNCHPGWMTPPSNIYIVAQRVAGACSGNTKQAQVADEQLAEVILHEFGHAIEFILLRSEFGGNRARAEGFATWFEMFASKYSTIVSQSKLKNKTYQLARLAIKDSPGFNFSGSLQDYARASMYFEAIEQRSGVIGLMKVYKAMATQQSNFFIAVDAELNLSHEKLELEILKLLDTQ